MLGTLDFARIRLRDPFNILRMSEFPDASSRSDRPRTIAERRFAERATELARLDLPTRFTRMYETNLWAGEESRSGDGSSLAATAGVRAGLPGLLHQLGVRRLLDIPCGDFHWMSHVDLAAAGVIGYVGGDIVEAVVTANRARYAAPDRSFVQVDLTKGPLPTVDGTAADAVLCRDCLVHLSFANIARALDVVRASGARYLITTTFLELTTNIDVVDGDWRPLNFQGPPFSFPPPEAVLVEGCEEEGGAYADKALAAWRTDRRQLAALARGRRQSVNGTPRPRVRAPGPEDERQAPERKHADAEQDHSELRRREHEDPPQQRHERWNGIEPHAVGARHLRRVPAQQHEPDDLPHELHENPRDDERVDHRS